jgi:hypothetical protein
MRQPDRAERRAVPSRANLPRLFGFYTENPEVTYRRAWGMAGRLDGQRWCVVVTPGDDGQLTALLYAGIENAEDGLDAWADCDPQRHMTVEDIAALNQPAGASRQGELREDGLDQGGPDDPGHPAKPALEFSGPPGQHADTLEGTDG